jgi:tetratricopeptide (TPR) repeat protein
VRARLRARRGKPAEALADLNEFLRQAPSRRAEALPAMAVLRKREPRHFGILTAAADLLMEERHYDEVASVLKEGLACTADPTLKLHLYMRQWRLHLVQGKDSLARQVLENAEALAPDRNQFLEAVHRLLLDRTLRSVEQLRERARAGVAAAAEVETLVSSLVLLGAHEEAREILSRHAAALERPRFARLHAAIAERRGDYRRAFEMGRSAGIDRRLVYCAERAGEVEEAHRMLARLIEEGQDVALEPRLARYELELLRRELERDRNVLQAETVVSFA